MNGRRAAGVLLPVSALPEGKIGSANSGAYRFVDFLAEAGQTYWQILPVGPVGEDRSPYQCSSAFAGNPEFIEDAVFAEYESHEHHDFKSFCESNAFWLDDYASFRADMPENQTRFLQFVFFKEWDKLRHYANDRGILIIGDLPFYVSESSSDIIYRRDLFLTDSDGKMALGAGVPPDAFSEAGQTWNNPLYNWDKMAEDGYAWWIARLKQAQMLYDACRIDHFRGLDEYFAIPVGETAAAGAWHRGPGKPFIDALKSACPGYPIIAEDLGILTDSVRELLRYSGFPGMNVLQFAFTPGDNSAYLPHNHKQHSIVYPGTHDNNTLIGWAAESGSAVTEFALEYLHVSEKADLPEAILRAALMSVSETAIIPMQDWLRLGSAARMNTPGTVSPANWSWRLGNGYELSARRMREMTDMYGRR